ncbi:hypothetical protein [Micromonospora purpureochromogenes]|uniref:Uncharacterized protein n=1 Tax=Micromonospora purpureochromogenes TaxID=47872 RepID=A0ABX2RK57_9ACTN|nr:hypothetical protein [Micromonospora purpureochromogenes]NYF55524.1 hypothetical protein [Micromonospora purpureochromogenes]
MAVVVDIALTSLSLIEDADGSLAAGPVPGRTVFGRASQGVQ